MGIPATEQDEYFLNIIKVWLSIIRDAGPAWDKLTRMYNSKVYDEQDDIERNIEEVEGSEGEDGVSDEFNLLFAHTDSLIANVVPDEPQMTIKPRTKAERDRIKNIEQALNDFLIQAKVGEKLDHVTRVHTILPRAFLKTTWDRKKQRPRVRVLHPRRVFYDLHADDWEDVRYVIEAVPMTQAQFEQNVRAKVFRKSCYYPVAEREIEFRGYDDWLDGENLDREAMKNKDTHREQGWTTVYHVYDLVGKKLRIYGGDLTNAALSEKPLPYTYLENPFIRCVWHENLSDLGGLGDGTLAFPSIQRLNELKTLKMWHLKTTIPVAVVDETSLDDPEEFYDAYDAIDGPGQYLKLKINASRTGKRVDDIISALPQPSMHPDWHRAEGALVDTTNTVLGNPAFSRGQEAKTDVATELSLMNEGFSGRNAKRQNRVYRHSEEVSIHFIALMAQFLPYDYAIEWEYEGEAKIATPSSMELGGVKDGRKPEFTPPNFSPDRFRIKSHPYNAEQMNSVAQLKKIQVLLQALLQNPNVDQRKLTAAILETAGLGDILASEEAAQQTQMAMDPAMQGAAGEMGGAMTEAEAEGAAPSPTEGGQVVDGTGAPPPAGAAGMGLNV